MTWQEDAKKALKDASKSPATLFGIFILFVIIVTGAILFMCLVGMITFDDPQVKANWVEISSQLLNACFTLNAILLVYPRSCLVLWTIYWSRATSEVERIRYANLIQQSVNAVHLPTETSLNLLPMNESRSKRLPSIPNAESAPETLRTMTDEVTKTPVWKWGALLACMTSQWVFQIPITIVMWMYAPNPTDRPAWVVPAFLPLSFLTGAIGGIWPILMARKSKRKVEEQQ